MSLFPESNAEPCSIEPGSGGIAYHPASKWEKRGGKDSLVSVMIKHEIFSTVPTLAIPRGRLSCRKGETLVREREFELIQ